MEDSSIGIAYDDNVRREVQEAFTDPIPKIDATTGHWSIAQVSTLLEKVETAVDGISCWSDLVKLSNLLGRIARNLDLTGSFATESTLRHLIGTLKCAAQLLSEGYTVHAIEGCDGSGVQLMGDLDLLYSLDTVVFAADYTHSSVDGSGLVALKESHSKLVSGKYGKLRTMYSGWVPMVITFAGLAKPTLSLGVNSFLSPRESDFAAADLLTQWTRSLSMREVREVLDAAAVTYGEHRSDRRGMVEAPRNAPLVGLGTMASQNGVKAAELYTNFRNLISAEAKAKYFSGQIYEDWCNTTVKADFKLPLYVTGCHERCPFARARCIVTLRDSLLLRTDSVIRALADLVDKDEADFMVPSGVAVMSRVMRDGQKFNAVKIRFPGKWTMEKWREHMKKKVPSMNYAGDLAAMETYFEAMDEDLMSEGPGGDDLSVIEQCVDGAMDDDLLGESVRKLMKGQLETISGTKIASWMSQKQELARALLSVPRKSQGLKGNKGGFFESSITMSVDTVGSRYAVVLTGMGPATFSSNAIWNYMVMGHSVEMAGALGSHEGVSRVLSSSMAMLDWDCTSLAKAVSYYTQIAEMRLAVKGKRTDLSHERSFPMMIMQQNSNKFAQASEMVRYLFVNGTGWCGSPSSLFDKISWFTPTTFTQKLYCLRMCKMSDVLQAFKSHNMTHELRLKHRGLVGTKEGGFMERNSEFWNVAMPNELVASESDHAIFNAFYVCRAMTIQRYNKLVSESLVLEKQLDSREEYLSVKRQNLSHELRFLSITRDEFKEALWKNLGSDYGPWSASWKSQTLAILSTCEILSQPQDVTVADVFNRVHDLQSVMRELKVSDVMNSRGSVLCNSKSGVVRFAKKKVSEKRTKTITQNSKCWMTLLLAMQSVVKEVDPPAADYYAVATEAFDDIDLNLDLLKTQNDSLWPLILWAADKHAICVSKMVHKDQIGAREIAVLNAWARVMCYYVECLARSVRDDEHRNGLRTNLIERPDKELIVEEMLLSGQANRRHGVNVMFDSADCSKWGPSMMPSNLYYTLSVRMNSDNHRAILRNCLSLFGAKLFKIPDHFYSKMTTSSLTSEKVGKVKARLMGMSREMGDYRNQIIRLEESMHQGILGVTSSVFGSDAHNLSNRVLRTVYASEGLTVKTYITSDDYSRLLTWTSDKGMFSLAKETLAIHNEVLLSCGIKRNLQKSSLSSHYMEFNSVYHTYSGTFRPDVKQRLSFVDYGHSLDPEPNAKRCMETSTEYLRNDGGLVGACWIGVLNNSLLMHQNQLHRLYSMVSSRIYNVPLELGGMVRINPLRFLESVSLLGYYKNYGNTVMEAYDQLASHLPSDVKELDTVVEEGVLKVCTMSRSGVVRLSTRVKRGSRAVREFMQSQPADFFKGVLSGVERNGLVLALIACAHREITVETTQGSANRLANCMHVHDAKVFRFNCTAYKKDQLVSRTDLDDLALCHARDDRPVVTVRRSALDLSRVQEADDALKVFSSNIHIADITWMPRKLFKEHCRVDIAPYGHAQSEMALFDQLWNPLNGSGVSAWDFLEAKEVYRNRLKKMSSRSQKVLLALMEGDQLGTTLHHRVLLSNYFAGCRAMLTGLDQVVQKRNVDRQLIDSMTALSNQKYNDDGVVLQFTSPMYAAMMRSGKVCKTDITGLLNILSGDGEYDFTNDALRVQVINCLIEAMRSKPGRFTVYPRRLSTSFAAIDHSTFAGFHIHQRPVRNRDFDVIGREFITKSGNMWHHDLFITEPGHTLPASKGADIVRVEVLDEPVYLEVKLMESSGCTAVSFLSGQLVQVLTVGVLETTSLLICTDHPLEEDLDYLVSLGIKDARIAQTVEFRDLFMQTQKAYPTLEEERAEVKEPSELEYLEEEDDFDEFDDFGADVFDDIMATLAIVGPSTAPTTEAYETEHKEEEEEEEEIDLSQYRPLSESQASRPLEVLNRLSTSSTMKNVTRRYAATMKLNRSQRVYRIDVPYKLSRSRFKDDDRGPALGKALESLLELPEVEAEFLRSYILDSVATYGAIITAFNDREADLASDPMLESDQKESGWF